jgi:hypothetical protein
LTAADEQALDAPQAVRRLGPRPARLTVQQLGDLIEDAEWILSQGRGWRHALDRLGRTAGQLDYLLRRASRADLIGSLKAVDRSR